MNSSVDVAFMTGEGETVSLPWRRSVPPFWTVNADPQVRFLPRSESVPSATSQVEEAMRFEERRSSPVPFVLLTFKGPPQGTPEEAYWMPEEAKERVRLPPPS